jgi:hypothetical protein
MASLDRVRVALERHAAHRRASNALDDNPPDAGPALPPSPKMTGDTPAALERLCKVFGLSAFECDTLLLCAGIELDGRFAALCASAQGDAARPWPTFGMALAALDEAHWSALLPQEPLRRWRLVEPGQGGVITTAPLRIDESVLHYLTGLESPDERLAGIIVPVGAPDEIVPSHGALAQRIAAAWQRAQPATLPLAQLCGDDPAGKRSIAAAACRQTGLRLLAVAADLLPTAPADLNTLLRLIERELLLRQSALLIECDDAESAEHARNAAIIRACEQLRAPLLLATRERRRLPHRAAITIEVARPTTGEQRAVRWHDLVGSIHRHDDACQPFIGRLESGEVVQHRFIDPQWRRGNNASLAWFDQSPAAQRRLRQKRAPMGLVERGERHPKRWPGARGIALGAGAEGGKPAIKLDARAEEQRVALEGREAEDLAETL